MKLKRALYALAAVLVLAVVAVAGGFWHVHTRALPEYSGSVTVNGPEGPVEIVRDRWAVPHIFAGNAADGWYGLGWAAGQDRLFHIAMLNHAVQGRLAEWLGPEAVQFDRIFRTLDLQGVGQRLYRRAAPRTRAAIEAYQRGVNAYAASLAGDLPVEFALLQVEWEPLEPGDMVGLLGFMTWALHDAWKFEPLYERLVAKVGADRAAGLFPHAPGGTPATYARSPALRSPALFRLTAAQADFLHTLVPRPGASNNWAVAPERSATGHALLANDPHLSHAVPPIWYQAHVQAGDLDVSGVTLPGLPFVLLGHNRHIAWGMTNLMADAADFFVEKLHPDDPGRVMYRGEWVDVKVRRETIRVRGGEPRTLEVRLTPHGPIVSGLLEHQERAVSYQWLYRKGGHDLDAFPALNRARDWGQFRAAVRRMSAITQNVVYADREGHIGMQASGRIPLRDGVSTGVRFRKGWDGSQEWRGYVPFERMPAVLDPPRGWVASANNPPLPAPVPYYIGSHYEPLDRIRRVRELLAGRERHTLSDMAAMQADVVMPSARRNAPLILEAFRAQPPERPTVRAALEHLRGWEGRMGADSAAAAVYGAFAEHLFREIFTDELGEALVPDLRERLNYWATMTEAVLRGGQEGFLDRTDTPSAEGRHAILRAALRAAVDTLLDELGDDPQAWRWGDLHTLEFTHPLGRLAVLAPYFNLGPYPMPGHGNTVNKAQFKSDWEVDHGASMRQITDLGDLDRSLTVLPTGQSGIPASPHYGDQAPLWRRGRYIEWPMSRERIEALAQGTLRLEPRR